MDEVPAACPSEKVINRPSASPADRKSPTLDMEIVPVRAEGLTFTREISRTPGASAKDRLMVAPSSMGESSAPPMNARRELIKPIVLGCKEVLTEISAEPPSLTTPSILAVQERKTAMRGTKNRIIDRFKKVILR